MPVAVSQTLSGRPRLAPRRECATEGDRRMELELLNADQWQVLREVRLRALKDSPGAYIADYEAEESGAEASWRQRFDHSEWVIARDNDRIIGLARVLRGDDRPSDERPIEAGWVDPRCRGAGVLRAILQYLTDGQPRIKDWLVWVLDDNIQ